MHCKMSSNINMFCSTLLLKCPKNMCGILLTTMFYHSIPKCITLLAFEHLQQVTLKCPMTEIFILTQHPLT